jgi:hypothetical protein
VRSQISCTNVLVSKPPVAVEVSAGAAEATFVPDDEAYIGS